MPSAGTLGGVEADLVDPRRDLVAVGTCRVDLDLGLLGQQRDLHAADPVDSARPKIPEGRKRARRAEEERKAGRGGTGRAAYPGLRRRWRSMLATHDVHVMPLTSRWTQVGDAAAAASEVAGAAGPGAAAFSTGAAFSTAA